MTYSDDQQRILDQIQELGGYRDTEELDDWYDGPHTRRELFKAFWRDQWDRSSGGTFVVIGVAAFAVIISLAAFHDVTNRKKQDTRGNDLACMRSCESLDGMMVEQTQYGCTCRLHKGGKRVLR